jgi:thiosulfate dehydrogenase [quinone] large subunit
MATQQRPVEQQIDTELFGRNVSFNYSETWVGYSLLGLRVVMAWVFLQAGLEKLSEGGFGDPLAWSSTGFLENAIAPANPLSGLFTWFANYGAVVDPLVVFGQILIGLALLTGAVVRFAALMGSIQMFFFWTAAWQDGLMAGFPVEHGYFVNSTFVYLLLLFGLGAWGAGRVVGLDAKLEASSIVQSNPWLRYLLG